MSVKILKDFRDNYNISREKQADLLEIRIGTLNNWEYRNKSIPKMKLRHVEHVFDTFKKVLKGEEEPIEVKGSFKNYNIEEKLNVMYEVLGTLVENTKDLKEQVNQNEQILSRTIRNQLEHNIESQKEIQKIKKDKAVRRLT